MYSQFMIFLITSLFCLTTLAEVVEPVDKTPLVQVENGWIREIPPTLTTTAAYMQIKNLTKQKLILVGAQSPDFAKVEMHKTIFEKDIARMVPVEKLVIPSQELVLFEPKGLHFMLIDRQRPLKAGDTVMLTLQFHSNQTQTVELEVKSGQGSHHHHP